MAQLSHLAIVGGGPRGLAALEHVLEALARTTTQPFVIHLFEASGLFGCGWVYDPGQPEYNWLNISDRALELPGRNPLSLGDVDIDPFPGYQEWAGWTGHEPETEADRFTTRANLGRYLSQRFNSLASPLVAAGIVHLYSEKITAVRPETDGFFLTTEDNRRFASREVLLAVGHQDTRPSRQLTSWAEHATRQGNCSLVPQPYPIGQYLEDRHIGKDKVIAIRGFGLAMIDMVRALVDKGGGQFTKEGEKIVFSRGAGVPEKIIPFSLDGLPLAAKPLNKKVDNKFNPGKKRLRQLEKELLPLTSATNPDTVYTTFVEAMARICSEQFATLRKAKTTADDDKLQQIAEQWLKDKVEHRLVTPGNLHPSEAIQRYVGMARGTYPCSFDYCIGQVWRHTHPTLYNFFAFSDLPKEAMEAIIGLDERIKRYSYGPPVASMEQLLALERASVLKFAVIDDPDIRLVEGGWELSEGQDRYVASVMINSVVDAPRLVEVETPLIGQLRRESILEPLHEELGAAIEQDFSLPWSASRDRPLIAMIGRLAKGSILGADAILECFNPYFDNWAKAVVDRYSKDTKA